jgi:peptide/nickel transport system permease protein
MRRTWWVAATVLVGLALGGLWPPHDVDRVALATRHAAPSLVHPMGTDHLGRDVLSRLLLGGWRTLLVLAFVCAVMLGLGVPVGLAAALAGPTGEAALLRLTDFCLIVPPLVLALAVSALCGFSPVTAGLALGLGSWGHYALFVQSLAKSVLAEPYVLAAHALGLTPVQIATRHVAPNVLPLVLVYLASDVGRHIGQYAALAFLGLGAETSRPDWGAMLFEYRGLMFEHMTLLLWPGLAIVITVLTLHVAIEPDWGRHQRRRHATW